jgi:amidase
MAKPFERSQPSGADLGLRSATELLELLDSGALSSVELLDHYLGRVERLNPDLNAIVTLDVERARDAARHADDQRTRHPDGLGPLHGLPFTIKDAIATAGIRSTGGAVELSSLVPEYDAPAVSALKDAGAIVFGKTNLPRWSGDVQAYNDLFGQTNNPWNLERIPGGSSGGAAAAVAAGLTSAELGTDIGGSVRLPAHFSGVCGHKPSFGLVPQLGYLDHARGGYGEPDINVFGPIARSTTDLGLLLDVIAGPTPERRPVWRSSLSPSRHADLADFRVAAWLDDETCPVSNDVAVLLDRATRAVEEAGASVDRRARPGVPLADVWEVGLPLVSAATSPARTDEEYARQIAQADDESLPRPTRMRAQASTIRHRDWLELDDRRHEHRRRWAEFFRNHDVLLCPVAFTPAFAHLHEGNLYSRTLRVDGVERAYADLIAWTTFIGYVYLPSTVIPVGVTPDGLPVGIQIVAPYLEDLTALRFAGHLEAILGGCTPPPMALLQTTGS